MSFFDFVAPIYERLVGSRRTERTLRHLEALASFSADDHLLDLGGGTGRIAARLRGKVREVTVLDVSEKMLQQCREKGLRCLEGNADTLPFADGAFDKVVIVDSLHHFPNHERVVSEVRRVLRLGGILLIEEFDPGTWSGRFAVFLEKLLTTMVQFYSPPELALFLERHGFEVSLHRVSGKTYYAAAKKDG